MTISASLSDEVPNRFEHARPPDLRLLLLKVGRSITTGADGADEPGRARNGCAKLGPYRQCDDKPRHDAERQLPDLRALQTALEGAQRDHREGIDSTAVTINVVFPDRIFVSGNLVLTGDQDRGAGFQSSRRLLYPDNGRAIQVACKPAR
jgi:hypothetical protein